ARRARHGPGEHERGGRPPRRPRRVPRPRRRGRSRSAGGGRPRRAGGRRPPHRLARRLGRRAVGDGRVLAHALRPGRRPRRAPGRGDHGAGGAIVKRMARVVVPLFAIAVIPALAAATPSTTYWAPSTAGCQAFAVPHVTYDTYFGKGPSVGAAGAPG